MHIYNNNTYIYIYIHDLKHMIYTYSTNLHIIYMFLSRVWITNMNFFRVHVHTNTHTHSNSYTCDTCRQSSLSRLENFGQDEAFAWGRTRYPENKLHTNYIELTKKLSAVHRVLQKTCSKITNAASKSRLTVDPQSVSNRDELLSVPFDSDFRHDWRIFKGMPSTFGI
jgi:hypothetical protein